MVVIGLTELPNSRWAKAHPAHPLAATLYIQISWSWEKIFLNTKLEKFDPFAAQKNDFQNRNYLWQGCIHNFSKLVHTLMTLNLYLLIPGVLRHSWSLLCSTCDNEFYDNMKDQCTSENYPLGCFSLAWGAYTAVKNASGAQYGYEQGQQSNC